ncbi:MAG: hypothetical protein FWJ70_00975 [Micromonosporaceae bacterium]|jgi:hypothetical protein
MALPDPPYDAKRVRQRHHDHLLAVSAPAVLGAAVTLQVVGLTTGNQVIEAGLASILWVAAILLTMAWFGTSMVRRLERHLCRIEGAQYRDGYAAGYLEATTRAKSNQHHERPNLRPVR